MKYTRYFNKSFLPCKMIVLYFISVLSLKGAVANRYSMPVLLIDTEHVLDVSINRNPFHEMSAESFNDVVHSATQRSERVVLFIENHFSAEDVSHRDAKGTPYWHIHQGFMGGKITYMPSVKQPFRTLKRHFKPLDANMLVLGDAMKPFDRNFKYYYVFFKDDGYNETRVEKLRRHDKVIKEVYYSIRRQSSGPIVAFYTGKVNPVLAARQTPGPRPSAKPQGAAREQEPRDVMVVTDEALFRLTGVYSTTTLGRSAQSAPVVAEQSVSRRSLSTRMLYSDFELEFDFLYLPNEWRLDAVVLLEGGEEVGRAPMGVGAPYDHSYYCAEPLVIPNYRDGSLVTISQYQVEALRTKNSFAGRFARNDDASDDPENADETTTDSADETTTETAPKTRFTKAVSCGPYFSAVILAALFVGGLLLAVTACGVAALFNCRTNGRYDDATHKPLVIVAQL